jgi:hypothetical protein
MPLAGALFNDAPTSHSMNDQKTQRPAPRPFAAGFAWLMSAIALLRSNAPRLLLLGLLLQMLGGASQVGVLGVLFLLAVPALTAGMLQGMHVAAQGGRPSAFVLFSAFSGSGRLLSLFMLGGLGMVLSFVLLTFLLAGTVANLDPELAARIQSGDQTAVAELDPALLQKVLVGVVAGLGLGLVLSFFAVPLIWFQGRSLWDALGTGIAALFREWRALTALGLALFALGLPVALVGGGIMATQLTASSPSMLLTVVFLVIIVVYQVLGFAAQYLAYRDLFMTETPSMTSGDRNGGPDDDAKGDDGNDEGQGGPPGPPGAKDDQLVA